MDMTRKAWFDLSPSLLMGVGIIASTWVSVVAARSGGPVLAGPLLLALAIVGVDVLGSRLRGGPSRPSAAALIVAGAFVLGSWIVALRDPSLVKTFIPLLGATSWPVLLLRSERRRKPCAIGLEDRRK
jgi:hypothetical protein